MGIKNLNRYLLEKCTKKSIRKIHLSDLSGKYLVIDTSIYLYKYAAENMLIENMFLLISVLRNYKIVPIFIFDGKPPNEKRELLKKRRLLKIEAETKYNTIKSNSSLSQQDMKAMENLKRQFITITDDDINKVKALMDCYGVTYFQSTGEADQLCCHFVHTNQVWGCLSEDMDMFAYGCTRVLRGISLLNHTVVLYKTTSVLKELDVSFDLFQYILIVCGTDYNLLPAATDREPTTTHPSIYNMFSTYKKYKLEHKQFGNSSPEETIGFHNWIIQQNNTLLDSTKQGHIIQSTEEIIKIKKLFDINHFPTLKKFVVPQNILGIYNIQNLIEFLYPYGFIFPKDIY